MRREGMLMEQRWCDNGTLVPAAQANSPIDPIWGPLWMVETLQDLVVALANATDFAPQQQAEGVRDGDGWACGDAGLARVALFVSLCHGPTSCRTLVLHGAVWCAEARARRHDRCATHDPDRSGGAWRRPAAAARPADPVGAV